MDQQVRMAKQMMDLQRVTFDGMINNMMMFWDQTERMLGSFMEQAPWVPQEGKRAFKDWVDGNKKGCETFKNAVNEGFSKLEGCFAGGGKPQQSETTY